MQKHLVARADSPHTLIPGLMHWTAAALNLSLPAKEAQQPSCKRGVLASSMNLSSAGVGQHLACGTATSCVGLDIPHSAPSNLGTPRRKQTLRSIKDVQLPLPAPLKVEGEIWAFRPKLKDFETKSSHSVCASVTKQGYCLPLGRVEVC